MLTYIPKELIRAISQYLPNIDKQNLSYTCSRFKRFDLYILKIRTKDMNKLPSLIRFINNIKIKISLDLTSCEGLSDVSAPGSSVTHLNLSDCHSIRDVSAFGSVTHLNLYNCNRISDVSALGSVTTLNLSWCDGITERF